MKIRDADETVKELGWTCLNELSTFGALSNNVIADLLQNGVVRQYQKGEYVARVDQVANDFQVILRGRVAYYRCFDGCDVLTRYFNQGEQMGFDQMIGLLKQNGTDVAQEDSLIVDISGEQFFKLRVDFPDDFGLLMINLAREMAREIEILENVIGNGSGWREDD